MSAKEARDYLAVAVATETGKQALRSLGYGMILDNPTRGDDASTIQIATALRTKLNQSYRF